MVEEIITAKFSTGVEASVGPLRPLSNAARILLSTRVSAESLPSQRPETNPIPASTSEFTQRAFALRELGYAISQKLRECRSAFKTSLDLVGGKDPERGVPAAIDQVQRYSELLRERIDYQAAVADWKAQSSTHQNTLLLSIGCETKEELTTRAATLDASYKELSKWLGRLFNRRELKTIEAAKGECEAVAKQISELAAHKSLDQGIDSFSFDDDPALKEIGLKIAQRVRSELVYGSLHELDIEEIPALQVPVELSHKVFIEEIATPKLVECAKQSGSEDGSTWVETGLAITRERLRACHAGTPPAEMANDSAIQALPHSLADAIRENLRTIERLADHASGAIAWISRSPERETSDQRSGEAIRLVEQLERELTLTPGYPKVLGHHRVAIEPRTELDFLNSAAGHFAMLLGPALRQAGYIDAATLKTFQDRTLRCVLSCIADSTPFNDNQYGDKLAGATCLLNLSPILLQQLEAGNPELFGSLVLAWKICQHANTNSSGYPKPGRISAVVAAYPNVAWPEEMLNLAKLADHPALTNFSHPEREQVFAVWEQSLMGLAARTLLENEGVHREIALRAIEKISGRIPPAVEDFFSEQLAGAGDARMQQKIAKVVLAHLEDRSDGTYKGRILDESALRADKETATRLVPHLIVSGDDQSLSIAATISGHSFADLKAVGTLLNRMKLRGYETPASQLRGTHDEKAGTKLARVIEFTKIEGATEAFSRLSALGLRPTAEVLPLMPELILQLDQIEIRYTQAKEAFGQLDYKPVSRTEIDPWAVALRGNDIHNFELQVSKISPVGRLDCYRYFAKQILTDAQEHGRTIEELGLDDRVARFHTAASGLRESKHYGLLNAKDIGAIMERPSPSARPHFMNNIFDPVITEFLNKSERDKSSGISDSARREILFANPSIARRYATPDYPIEVPGLVLPELLRLPGGEEAVLRMHIPFPPSCEIFQDKYQREYLSTYLRESPEAARKIFIQAALRADKFSREQSKALITALSITHAVPAVVNDPKVKEVLDSKNKFDVAPLLKAIRASAAGVLAARYPEHLMSTVSIERLTRFCEVLPVFEQSLLSRNMATAIPVVRVLAVVELMGAEARLRKRDPELLREIARDAERLFPDETTRPQSLAYLERYYNKNASAAFELLTPEQQSAWLAQTSLETTWEMTTEEDRLNTTQSRLHELASPGTGHLSVDVQEALRQFGGLRDMEALATSWRTLNSYLPALKSYLQQSEAGQGRGPNSQLTIPPIPPEFAHLPHAEATRQIEGELVHIKRTQSEARAWGPLVQLTSKLLPELGESLTKIAGQRGRIGDYSDLVEQLGFSFTESFRDKFFRGDVTLLADAIRGNLKSDPNGKDANLMRLLNATVDALVGDLQESSKLLQKVAAQAQKCRELLCARKEQITSILDSIPPDASKEAAHAALVAGMPEFALRAEALLSAASTGQALVAAVKKATDDSQALSDLEHIIGAIRGEHSDESVTYAPAQHFTDMLWALRGQCLDFRANRNSIGNFVYLPSYADRDRMVITAQDAQERALCNAPIALYVIDRAGEKMPAIILDKLYVPGGGIFKESQLTGYLDYARQLAALTGLPVVMPAFIFAGRPLSFEKAAAYFTGVRTIAATDEEVRIRITLGPSGSTYHEFVDFSFYGTETDVPVRALIIEARTINGAKPEPAAAGAAAAP